MDQSKFFALQKEHKELSEQSEIISAKLLELSEKFSKYENELKNDNKLIERLEQGSKYYYVDTFEGDIVDYVNDDYTIYDNHLYNTYNYFHTEEEAKKHAEYIFLTLKVLRAIRKVNGDWKPDYSDCRETKHVLNCRENQIVGGQSYLYDNFFSFKSEEVRDNFRKYVSDEEIRTFLNPLGAI